MAHIFRTYPFAWIVDQAFAQQVETIRARSRKEVAQQRLGELSNGHVVGQLGVSLETAMTVSPKRTARGQRRRRELRCTIEREWRKTAATYRPLLLGRRPERAEDGLELVHVRLAGEIRRAQHELRKDAADGPDVDRCAVVPASPKELRGSIPSTCRVVRAKWKRERRKASSGPRNGDGRRTA